MVSLIKIIDGTAVADGLPNEHFINCPRCSQTYRLGYDDAEWHRVKDWMKLAEAALRRDHDARHTAAMITLQWRGIRRR